MNREVNETLAAFLLMAFGLAIGTLFGSSQTLNIATFAHIAEAAAHIATTVGIMIGGAWAYKRYIDRNEGDGHAELSHHVEVMPTSTGTVLRVTLAIKNSGQVEFRPNKGDICVQLPPAVFNSDDEPCDAWQTHVKVDLPFVANRFSLENGALERYCRDFKVPENTQWVQVHSNVHAGPAHWDETSLHQIK